MEHLPRIHNVLRARPPTSEFNVRSSGSNIEVRSRSWDFNVRCSLERDRLRPISTLASFFLSTSANFDFCQFDFGQFLDVEFWDDKVWGPRRVGSPEGGEPRRVEPRKVEPRRVRAQKGGRHNFALFFPQFSFFLLSLGSFRILVVFEAGALKCARLEFSGCRVRALAAPMKDID